MNGTDINWLLARLPPVRRIELRDEADYYGASALIADRLHLRKTPVSLATWMHGWCYCDEVSHPRQLVHRGRTDQVNLVATADEAAALHRFGFRKAVAVGLPFCYAKPPVVERVPRSLLVMPAHTTLHTKHQWRQREYAQAIAAIRDAFSTVVVCISETCLRNGLWAAAFEECGLPWIPGAAVHDRNALARMATLFSSFEFMTTNVLGSHVPYAAYRGCKVSIFGPYAERKENDYVGEPFYQEHPEVLGRIVRSLAESTVRRLFPQFFVHPLQGVGAQEWAGAVMGADHLRTPRELARLLGWTWSAQLRHVAVPRIRQAVQRTWWRTASCRPIGAVYYRLRELLGLAPRGDWETCLRLRRAFAHGPRRVAGEFRFEFGTVRYLDGYNLLCQFTQIFLEKVYDFDCGTPSPHILDCGGNIGLSAIWFKRKFPRSRVRVFEADPRIASLLQANLAAAGCGEVAVTAAAVWTSAGEIAFDAEGTDSGRISGGAARVPCVRLSDCLVDPVDLLKLDIEGAEHAVILDLCATDAIRHVRRLICEVHGRRDTRGRLGEVLAALVAKGFDYTFTSVQAAPFLPGEAEPTPFPAARDARHVFQLYAWQ